MFPDFERDIDKNIFNIAVLNRYCDQFTKELLKLFEEKSDRIECFQGEYVYSGCDMYSGEYWRVTLDENIRHADNIYLSKQKDLELGPFPPDDKKV